MYWNYTGMVCKITNKPHGFGRGVKTDSKWFVDGQFKNGEAHGFMRGIH